MGYEVAFKKAWEDLAKLSPKKPLSVKFLGDEYGIDLECKKVILLFSYLAAKDFLSIIILHYLAQEIKGLPKLTGEWLTFREFSGVEGYYEAFRKRSVEPIIKKYGSNPEAIKGALNRLPAKEFSGGDIGIILEVFAQVLVLVKFWKADEEFGADANIYFDANITKIFCIEDIVVLAGLVASKL
ncbi:MAG: DUF3786 domain-containing protein [Candidatus Omnitrophica bacterium]|nr:DUF3786 domain-containing protein [Candidatus Omnitrophota bacterium]